MDEDVVEIRGELTISPREGLKGKVTYTAHGHRVSVYHDGKNRDGGARTGYFVVGESADPNDREKVEESLGAGQAMIELPQELIPLVAWHIKMTRCFQEGGYNPPSLQIEQGGYDPRLKEGKKS